MLSKTEQLLYLVGQDYTLVRKGMYFSIQEHDSFVIDPRKGIFFWNSKGIYGDAISYLLHVRGMNYNDALSLLSQVINKKSVGFKIPDFSAKKESPNIASVGVFHRFCLNQPELMAYWYNKRGYTLETIKRYKLGHDGEYWLIPIFDHGEFKNFQCRGYDVYGNKIIKSYYSGLGRLRFNFDLLPVELETPIFIAEAIVDAIIMGQSGDFAVSHNSGASGWDHDWSQDLLNYSRVFILGDNDEAGRKGAIRTSKYLQHNSEILVWPDEYPEGYDITDLYKSGKTVHDLRDCFLPSYLLKG